MIGLFLFAGVPLGIVALLYGLGALIAWLEHVLSRVNRKYDSNNKS